MNNNNNNMDNNNNNNGNRNGDDADNDYKNKSDLDDEEDFPEYANEQNKKLNHIIKEKRKLIKEFRGKFMEKIDRMTVIQEHFKNVKNELIHTQ